MVSFRLPVGRPPGYLRSRQRGAGNTYLADAASLGHTVSYFLLITCSTSVSILFWFVNCPQEVNFTGPKAVIMFVSASAARRSSDDRLLARFIVSARTYAA